MTSLDLLPVAADLFRATPEGAVLVGTTCTGCGTYYFPKSLSCRNPACDVKTVHEVEFGSHGRLYSYTVQAYQPPALFRMQSWKPYAIGLVELPEGLRVMGMLTGCDLDRIEIDMPVELVLKTLYQDDQGSDVTTYMYAPAGHGATS